MKKSILSLVAVGLSLTLLGCPPPEESGTGTEGTEATSQPADGGEAAGGETDGGEAAGGEEAPGGGDPDISHVKAGQDYVFESVAGSNPPSKMIYRVTDVKDGKITYEMISVIDMGGEMKEMPAGGAQTWPPEVVAPTGETPDAPKVETKELPNETVKVGDMEFECKVTETEMPGGAGTSKLWLPMKPAGVMTFPPMIKTTMTGGAMDTAMTLVEVKDK